MRVLFCYENFMNNFVLYITVLSIEAAIIELPDGSHEYGGNKIQSEKYLRSSDGSNDTTVNITKVTENESSQKSMSTIQSSSHSFVPFPNEEISSPNSETKHYKRNASLPVSGMKKFSDTNALLFPSAEDAMKTSTVKKTQTNASLISAEPAIPETSIYQPIIHLENEINREFFQYLSILENPFLQRLAKKILKIQVPFEDFKIGSLVKDDYLSQKQTRSIFKLSKHAVPSLLRCRQPESTVTIKCTSNIARITFLSDSESRFNAKASVYRKPGTEITLDGYKLNAYLVWWTEGNETKSELGYKLTKEKIERKCYGCSHLETMLKLEGENHACLISVNCKQPQNENITFDASKLSVKHFVRNIPIITTSMTVHDLDNKDGSLLAEEITSGNDVSVLIQATSDTIPIGIFVRECKVTPNKMKSVPILVNGCSISNMLENFKVATTSNDKSKKFVTTAKFIPFTMRNTSQNLTLGCSLRVCEGRCDVHSACQTNFETHPYALNSRPINEVYLETAYKVVAETVTQGPFTSLVGQQPIQKGPIEVVACLETNTHTVSREVCYFYLILVCLLFIILLATTILYLTRRKKTWMVNKHEEIESSPRTLYPYNSNARKRSPTSSSILNIGD